MDPLKTALQTLVELAGSQPLFIVGGALRSHLLAAPNNDFDFAARGAAALARAFAGSQRAHAAPLDDTPGRETFRIATRSGCTFDISEMQGGGIEQDLRQRDFTCNAMALSPQDFLAGRNNLIDPCAGRQDIRGKVVRVLPGPTFMADPLRILRAFRFAAQLRFTITPETLAKIGEHRQELRRTAAERIAYELKLFFTAADTADLLPPLRQTGVLAEIFPSVAAFAADARQWPAIAAAYEATENLLAAPQRLFPDGAAIAAHMPPEKNGLVKLACLLSHAGDGGDSGNPAKRGKDALIRMLEKLRFSNDDITYAVHSARLCNTIRDNALRILEAPEPAAAIYALIKSGGQRLMPGLLLAAAHLESGEPVKPCPALRAIAAFYLEQYLPAQARPALLTGDDLIREHQLSPSPRFKEILEQVEAARVLGRVTTPEEARALARQLLQLS